MWTRQHVHYVDEMKEVLADLGNKLHVLSGTNTDSERAVTPAAFEGIDDFKIETDTLFEALTECRVVRYLLRETTTGQEGPGRLPAVSRLAVWQWPNGQSMDSLTHSGSAELLPR